MASVPPEQLLKLRVRQMLSSATKTVLMLLTGTVHINPPGRWALHGGKTTRCKENTYIGIAPPIVQDSRSTSGWNLDAVGLGYIG